MPNLKWNICTVKTCFLLFVKFWTKLTKQILNKTRPTKSSQNQTKQSSSKPNLDKPKWNNQTRPFSIKTQSKHIDQTKLSQFKPYQRSQTTTYQTKQNWIQTSILKDLQCPKVRCNSCRPILVFFSFFFHPWSIYKH